MGMPRLKYFLNQVRAVSMLGLPVISLIFTYYGIRLLRVDCYVNWIDHLFERPDAYWLITITIFLIYFINYRKRNGYLELMRGMGLSTVGYLLTVTSVTFLFSLPILLPFVKLEYERASCIGVEGNPLFFAAVYLIERILFLIFLVGIFFRGRGSWLLALFPAIIFIEHLMVHMFDLALYDYLFMFPLGPLLLWTQAIFWNPYVWLLTTIAVGLLGVKLWS